MNHLNFVGQHAVVSGGATGFGFGFGISLSLDFAIAQRLLASNVAVTLQDVNAAALDKAKAQLGLGIDRKFKRMRPSIASVWDTQMPLISAVLTVAANTINK